MNTRKFTAFDKKNHNKWRQDSNLIKEIYCNKFVEKLNDDQISELRGLIGRTIITETNVHDKSNMKTHSVLGLFYRMYFRKVMYNLKNKEAYSAVCDEYFTIFPIELMSDHWVQYQHQSARNHLDAFTANDKNGNNIITLLKISGNILDDIKNYLQLNGFIVINESKDIEWLLRLIINHSNSLKRDDEMKSLLDINLLKDNRETYVNILKKYLFFFKFCQQSYTYYTEHSDRGYYFRLVDSVELSKKYQFALLYKKYALYRGDISNFVEDIFSLSSFIQQESYGIDRIPCSIDDVDPLLLGNLKRYIEKNFSERDIINPGSRLIDYIVDQRADGKQSTTNSTPVKYMTDLKRAKQLLDSYYLQRDDENKKPKFEVDACFLSWNAILYSHDRIIHMCHSKRKSDKISSFYNVIIGAALLSTNVPPIGKLVIYNAYYGTESSIAMPENVEHIKHFVRKHHDRDTWKEHHSMLF